MAKLKEGVELQPYGIGSKVFSGEIENETAQYFLDSGKASPEDFEEMPEGDKEIATKKTKKK